MREASCCSERSSKSEGLWSSKVPWRADINSILEHREEVFQRSLEESWLNCEIKKCKGICGPVVHTRLMMLPRLEVQFPKRTRLVDAF